MLSEIGQLSMKSYFGFVRIFWISAFLSLAIPCSALEFNLNYAIKGVLGLGVTYVLTFKLGGAFAHYGRLMRDLADMY